MSSVLESEHTSMVALNDLNSVLLEGEIVKVFPPLEEPSLITQVELRTCRYNRKDARKNSTSFVRVDVQTMHEQRRPELFIGRKVRVVGRLSIPHKKPALLVAEHVELRPVQAGSRD
jgi:hypothetical protein